MKTFLNLFLIMAIALFGSGTGAFAQTTPTPTPTTEQLQQTIIELQRQLLAKQNTASVEQAKPAEPTQDEINKSKAEKLVKARLKDPDSYQNISWLACEGNASSTEQICKIVAKEKYVRYNGVKRDKTPDDVIYILTYRAKNSYGGYSSKRGMEMFWVTKTAPFVSSYDPVNFAILTQVASYMSDHKMD